ncbi:MAG: MBL fold metallo-hydrolase [Methanosphaera stadtmanae]|jgi:glyoxylase-like metal-dependent hydrolase (beta-lactamase superfamily II)|nr:MBL fold metallo-hydrolase [Methanosphaera stadtmanae]
MKIQAIKYYENGFMTQPFAFGGEEGMDKFDPSIKYRASLQNYVIQTENDLILVDTGIPENFEDPERDDNAPIYNGDRIKSYLSALQDLGYKPEDVTKILLTHKHIDHSGELKSFPNAKIYLSKTEASELNLEGDNVVAVEFTDGSYHNFPKSQKIVDGIYLIEAIGHTTGNSIIIAEDEDKYYMIHGDVTYTDEALYANKLSIVFEDIEAARQTLDNVRQFIAENPTVYLSTHTPLGPENLENQAIMDLNNPPESIKPE